MKVAFSM